MSHLVFYIFLWLINSNLGIDDVDSTVPSNENPGECLASSSDCQGKPNEKYPTMGSISPATGSQHAHISLPTQFIPIIEELDTEEKLFELLPKEEYGTSKQQQVKNKGTFNNLLFAIYEEECLSELMSNPLFVAGHYTTGPGVFHTVRIKKSVFPKLISEWNLPQHQCLHILFIKKGFYYNDYYRFKRFQGTSPQALASFLEEQMLVEMKITNDMPYDILVFWWEDESDANEVGYIITEQTSPQNSFLGHIFYAEHADTQRLVNWFVTTGDQMVSIKNSDYCKQQKIDNVDICEEKFRGFFKSFAYDFWARKKEALNYVQRNIVKPVTDTGFILFDLPQDIKGSLVMSTQWSDEEHWWTLENHTAPVLNQDDAPSYLSSLGDEVLEELERWMAPKAREWSQIESLELVNFFGLRKYTKNCQMQTHCDPVIRHLFTAVIYVASSFDATNSNGDKPNWPLQILDNHDVLHEINMEQGQVLLYESARNPFSRTKPLSTDFYITLYAHFKPSDPNVHNYDWLFQPDGSII